MPIVTVARRFLGQLGAGRCRYRRTCRAGLGGRARSFAAEPPPEITTIRWKRLMAPALRQNCGRDAASRRGIYRRPLPNHRYHRGGWRW